MKMRSTRTSQATRRRQAEERILMAAAALLARHGSVGMTLAEVGETAGYSRGLPAHYFGNKEGLIRALTEEIREWPSKLVGRRKPLPGLDAIWEFVETWMVTMEQRPDFVHAYVVLMNEACTTASSIRDDMMEAHNDFAKFYERQIRAGIGTGEMRSDLDAQQQAVILACQVRGIINHWHIKSGKVDLRKIRLVLRDNLIRLLRAE